MLSIYVAIAENGVIGSDNKIPWRLSSDMKRLSQMTRGHKVIMGRKTYESILARLGKPLPDRTSIIITTQKDYTAPECIVVHSLEEALQKISDTEEAFVFGGAGIYKDSLAYADKMYITKVRAEIPGDTYFSEINLDDWNLRQEEKHQKDEKNEYDYAYLTYERKH